jgi:hypothetical protein
VTDVSAAVAANLERYARFREDPARAVWHAVRRALVSHLMIQPLSTETLAVLPWVPIAATALDLTPLDLVERTLAGLAERGVVVSDGGTYDVTVPYEAREPQAT